MKTSDFDYLLPEELIAQSPPASRGASRLLVFHREKGRISHKSFSDIINLFDEGDLLVFNDTKVIPARLFGHKETGGRIELLLIREIEEDLWECMLKSSKGSKVGMTFSLGEGDDLIRALVVDRKEGSAIVKLSSAGGVKEMINKVGRMPLPPYVKRDAVKEDEERYQTIYASKEGAVAAPTAGLHFTPELMQGLKEKGVDSAMITLHVGPGTFQPVRVDDLENHRMHSEHFQISESVAKKINEVKERGGRVIAVGTTTVRTLESSNDKGKVLPNEGETDIFVRPGSRFNVVDCMITNFHLPKSTLFMLVSAFAGTANMKKVYEEAVLEKYRFFSYGDAMLII
ncbi:MAG: tRNA preQ1(34) S-adenosylmethionine ribosyltransferase-isomerase QueA [bacterium]|nr:tRNA preQ1(34) S-adenosylmethionine ribosyltransferase-isomerase QueA [bacterium]